MKFDESQIKWVELKLELPDDVGARLEEVAAGAGLSLKCYFVQVLWRSLLEDATPEQKETWQQELPAVMRRNGCPDSQALQPPV